MDTSENTREFENPASTHTPQNYTCSTLTSGGSRKTQVVSNKYRSGWLEKLYEVPISQTTDSICLAFVLQLHRRIRYAQSSITWAQGFAREEHVGAVLCHGVFMNLRVFGIREPRQGKRDSTRARPLQTFSSLASIGSQGLKNTFLLHNALLLLLNLGKCSHNFVTFLLEYVVLCLVHVFLSDCRVLLIDLLLTSTLGNSR